MNRKWLPNFSELIDRLSIHQLKEVFIPEHKDKYAREMKDIENDINIIIKEKDIKLTAKMIRSIIVMAQMNEHIWYNESKARSGEDQDASLLKLTHGINGIRNSAGNYLLEQIGDSDRKDWKIDCLAAEFKDWEISLLPEIDE
jgi:hypothetical protein